MIELTPADLPDALASMDSGGLPRCPNSDGNACEQYRLQGQRCQDCPNTAPGITDEEMREILAQEYEKDKTHFAQIPRGLRKNKPKEYALWRGLIEPALRAMRAVASRTRHQRSEVMDETTLNAWIDELSHEANRADSGDGWILTDIGRTARTLAKQRVPVLLELRTRPVTPTPAPDAMAEAVEIMRPFEKAADNWKHFADTDELFICNFRQSEVYSAVSIRVLDLRRAADFIARHTKEPSPNASPR